MVVVLGWVGEDLRWSPSERLNKKWGCGGVGNGWWKEGRGSVHF